MKRILFFAAISIYQIQIIQSSIGVGPPALNISSDNSANYAENFVAKVLSGTKFCESVLLPSNHTLLKKSLHATLLDANRNDTGLIDKDRLDSCCRSLHKCEASENSEQSDSRNDSSIQYCDCVKYFRVCLKNLNTSMSSDLAFIHSVNSTKCYAREHPIAKCIEFETYTGPGIQYMRTVDAALNETFFKRCKKYEFDYSQPKKLQLLDLPLSDAGILAVAAATISLSEDTESLSNVKNQTDETKSITSDAATIGGNVKDGQYSGDSTSTEKYDALSMLFEMYVKMYENEKGESVRTDETKPITSEVATIGIKDKNGNVTDGQGPDDSSSTEQYNGIVGLIEMLANMDEKSESVRTDETKPITSEVATMSMNDKNGNVGDRQDSYYSVSTEVVGGISKMAVKTSSDSNYFSITNCYNCNIKVHNY